MIDSFFLPLVLNREVVFIGKSEYFAGKGVKGRLQAGFFRGVGTIPVDRSGGKASEAALRTGLARLAEGKLFGIYPEGTRSPDGRLYRGKTGVARLAIESGAPVIPVAMVGTDVAQPIGRRIPKLMRIGVIFGEPMDFSRYQGMENDRFILRSVTDEIMYEIMRLSGQEYVASTPPRSRPGRGGSGLAAPGGAPGTGCRSPPRRSSRARSGWRPRCREHGGRRAPRGTADHPARHTLGCARAPAAPPLFDEGS